MLAQQQHARTIHERLRNPPNAVEDKGIDLKRKVIPIAHIEQVQDVPVAVRPSSFETQIAVAREATPAIFQRVDISLIQKVVCEHFAIEKEDLIGQCRRNCVVWPRQVGMYFARRLTKSSLPYIGLKFGDRDHTTAINAIYRVEKKRAAEKSLDVELSLLEAKIVSRRPIST